MSKLFFKTPGSPNLSSHTTTDSTDHNNSVIFKASCWDCNDFYIRKTKRRVHDWKTEHFKVLLKHDHSSAIADRFKTTGLYWSQHQMGPFWHLASGKTDYHCKDKETLIIQELQPEGQCEQWKAFALLRNSLKTVYKSTIMVLGTLRYPDFHAHVRLAPFWIHDHLIVSFPHKLTFSRGDQ